MHLFHRFDVGRWFCSQFFLVAGHLVRGFEQASIQSAELDFWTRVDNPVYFDRIGRRCCLEQQSTLNFDETVVDADGAQRHLEPDLLCVADACGGFAGHRVDTVDDLSVHEDKFFTNAVCDLFVRSLLRLGGLRYYSQCIDRLA